MRFLTIKLHLLLLTTMNVFLYGFSCYRGTWFKLAKKHLDLSLWFFFFILCCRCSKGVWLEATSFGGSWGTLWGAGSVSLSSGLNFAIDQNSHVYRPSMLSFFLFFFLFFLFYVNVMLQYLPLKRTLIKWIFMLCYAIS